MFSPPVPRRATVHAASVPTSLLDTSYEEGLGASNVYSLGPTLAMPANSPVIYDQEMDDKGAWRTVFFYTPDPSHLLCGLSALDHVSRAQHPPICLPTHHFSVRTHSYYSGLMAIIFQVIRWPVWQAQTGFVSIGGLTQTPRKSIGFSITDKDFWIRLLVPWHCYSLLHLINDLRLLWFLFILNFDCKYNIKYKDLETKND